MKKILFFISILGLAGCSSKTVQNNFAEAIKVGDVEVGAGQCAADWGEGFFGLFGDFPLKITKADGEKLHTENEEEYAAAHYVVGVEGKVTEAEEACESKDEEEAEEKGAETETGAETPADATTNTGETSGETATPATGTDTSAGATPGPGTDPATEATDDSEAGSTPMQVPQ